MDSEVMRKVIARQQKFQELMASSKPLVFSPDLNTGIFSEPESDSNNSDNNKNLELNQIKAEDILNTPEKDILEVHTQPEDYEAIIESSPPLKVDPKSDTYKDHVLVEGHYQRFNILNKLNEGSLCDASAINLVKEIANNPKHPILITEKVQLEDSPLGSCPLDEEKAATSACNDKPVMIEGLSQISFPSATAFIDRIINEEFINGDDPCDSKRDSDVLVIDTPAEDYKILESPSIQKLKSIVVIPETQDTKIKLHSRITAPPITDA